MMISGYKRRKHTEAQIKRIFIYSVILFLLTVAENSFFGSLRLLPSTPDLILGAVAVIALTDSRETSCIMAIIGGIMADAICGVGIYLSPILYFVVVLLICPFSKKMMRSYLSWLAILPLALIMRALYTVAKAYIFGSGIEIVQLLRYAVLPEAICTAIFSLCLYPIITLSVRLVRGRRDI